MSDLVYQNEIIKKDIECVLFDKDGTLIDIHNYWCSMIALRANFIFNRLAPSYAHRENFIVDLIELMGVDHKKKLMKPEGPVGIKPREYIIRIVTKKLQSLKINAAEDLVSSIFKEVDKYSELHLKDFVKLLPGVRNFLDALKSKDVSINIVSTDITSRAVKSIKCLKLEDYFDNILGGDSVRNVKPNPEIANKIIRKIGCNPEKCVVIGDHPVDILMGDRANVGLSIAVCNGISPRSAFKNLPCKIVKNLELMTVN